MPTNKYWRERFTQLESQAHRNAARTLAQLEQAYKQAQAEIEKQTLHWYQRFADNNGITMAQARVRLNDPQLKELKWTVQEYIKAGREMALDGRWMKELENASARFHITRFEALQLQNQQTIEALFGNQRDQMDRLLKRQFLDSYYHSAFEVQRGFGVGWDIAAIDEGALARIINRPWSTDGKNFSQRIWGSKQRLIGELQKEMTQNLLTGRAPDASIDAIAKQFGVSRNQAGRLVMTESAYFASISQQDAFNTLGVKQFQIVATLDERTSDICQELDGQVFEMKDFEAGISAPPFHPWCRSVTAPYFDDLQGVGERAARGEDGGVYYVPREMKYEEWHDTFVSGGSKQNVQPVSPIAGMVNMGNSLAQRLGDVHYQAMHDMLVNSPDQKVAQVWKQYEDRIIVGDPNYKGNAYCQYDRIYLDIQFDAKGSSWSAPYQTAFHEGGHVIDNLARVQGQPISVGFQNNLFPNTIVDEVNDWVNAVNNKMRDAFKANKNDAQWLFDNKYIGQWEFDYFQKSGKWMHGAPKHSIKLAYKAIEREIAALPPSAAGNLSDIVEGATRAKIKPGFGHGKSYWDKRMIGSVNAGVAKEAFAEMIDSTIASPENLEAIKKYLPKSYDVFVKIIDSMIP